MPTKRLFEVSVNDRLYRAAIPKVLLVVADDEQDARSVPGVGAGAVLDVAAVEGTVSAAGPSRVIGWTRGRPTGPTAALAGMVPAAE